MAYQWHINRAHTLGAVKNKKVWMDGRYIRPAKELPFTSSPKDRVVAALLTASVIITLTAIALAYWAGTK